MAVVTGNSFDFFGELRFANMCLTRVFSIWILGLNTDVLAEHLYLQGDDQRRWPSLELCLLAIMRL